MEMARRFVLVGLFVVVSPGSILQIMLGTIFCAFYLCETCTTMTLALAPTFLNVAITMLTAPASLHADLRPNL